MRSGLMRFVRETGFLPSLRAVTKSYRKNPVSGPPVRPLEKINEIAPNGLRVGMIFSQSVQKDF